MATKDVTGLVLAGGASMRFGSDKLAFYVGEKPMITYACEALRAVSSNVLVSIREKTSLDPDNVCNATLITDHYQDSGPLAGLHAGLRACETLWLLVVAGDMPFITVDALRILLAQRTPAYTAIVAQDAGGRLHPLCACYHQSVLALVEERLEAGKRAMHGLLDALPDVHYVVLPDASLQNVNTLSDL